LPSKPKGPDIRTAPIYYGACPQTYAKGRAGRGTYFAEALVDCLNGAGLQGPIIGSSMPVAKTYWHINVLSLISALQDRITLIAARDKESQVVVSGGMLNSEIFCAALVPPPVTIIINVDPDDAAKVAFAELWKKYRTDRIGERMPCWERPAKLNAVNPGLYILEVSASPPYPTQSIVAVSAQPPLWNESIKLS
jgi:hypothetical protein